MSTKKNSSYGLISIIDEKINTYSDINKLDGYRIYSNDEIEIFGNIDIVELYSEIPTNITTNSILKLKESTLLPTTATINIPITVSKILNYSLNTQVLHEYTPTSYNKHGYVLCPEICDSKVNASSHTGLKITIFIVDNLINLWKSEGKPEHSGFYINYYFKCKI